MTIHKKGAAKALLLVAAFTFLLSTSQHLLWVNVKWRPSSHHRFYLVLQQNRIGTWECWQNFTISPYLLITVRLYDAVTQVSTCESLHRFRCLTIPAGQNFAMKGRVTLRTVKLSRVFYYTLQCWAGPQRGSFLF